MADYYYVLSINLSPKHAQQLKQKTILIDTKNFTPQETQTLIDWFARYNINISHQLQPQDADIGTMVLILMMIGIIGGITIGIMYNHFSMAYHFVGNYLFLLGFAFVIAFALSFTLIKRQKKALWFLTTMIASGFLTPMLYGLTMKGYELYHEQQVTSQNLKPSYEFEFALTKNKADRQTWEIINFYHHKNGKYSKTEQPQFRDLAIYATPNDKTWQANATTNSKITVPVYQIGDDWFFYPNQVTLKSP